MFNHVIFGHNWIYLKFGEQGACACEIETNDNVSSINIWK
jgi:hypothetical protein